MNGKGKWLPWVNADLDGIWTVWRGYGLHFRKSAIYPEWWDEHHRIRCRVAYFGGWRLTFIWPEKNTKRNGENPPALQ